LTGVAVRLVLASANPAKVTEIEELLESVAGIQVLPRPGWVPDVEETGETLVENARLKARAVAAATGEGAIADDTGLEVAALGGAPGVRSARFAGEPTDDDKNVAKLLVELERVGATTPTSRRAVFKTVAYAVLPDGSELSCTGEVSGHITSRRRGAHGFGYDPVFAPDDDPGRTFAEMTRAEKQQLSHRSRAFTGLVGLLANHLASPG